MRESISECKPSPVGTKHSHKYSSLFNSTLHFYVILSNYSYYYINISFDIKKSNNYAVKILYEFD